MAHFRVVLSSTNMRLCLPLLAAAIAVAQPAPQPPLARLEANIRRVTQSVNATWGIYIKCMETGEEIAIDADRQMDTMSVIKIPLMAEAFRQIGEGKFKLADRIRLTDAAKQPGTGIIRSLDPGVELTIKDLLTLMIIVSDNTATDLIFDQVGGVDPVNRLVKEWGLSSIRATGKADVWFKALRAAAGAEAFHREAKTPFGLSSPRDMAGCSRSSKRARRSARKPARKCCKFSAARSTARASHGIFRDTGFRIKPAISCRISATMSGCWRARRNASS